MALSSTILNLIYISISIINHWGIVTYAASTASTAVGISPVVASVVTFARGVRLSRLGSDIRLWPEVDRRIGHGGIVDKRAERSRYCSHLMLSSNQKPVSRHIVCGASLWRVE